MKVGGHPTWNATTLRQIKRLSACDRCLRAQANNEVAPVMGATLQLSGGDPRALGNAEAWKEAA